MFILQNIAGNNMQETRQYILEILRDIGQSTVDGIVDELRKRRGDKITAVTVRHHLNILQNENLITPPQLLHRSTPGRPQHVYELTDQAHEYFPSNYQQLASGLFNRIKSHLPPSEVNVILEGVAEDMASDAQIEDCPLNEKIGKVVKYLNDHGYNASVEEIDNGFILKTCNCPYHEIAKTNDALCQMDMRFISSMLGIVPRLVSRISDGDTSCAYLIPTQ